MTKARSYSSKIKEKQCPPKIAEVEFAKCKRKVDTRGTFKPTLSNSPQLKIKLVVGTFKNGDTCNFRLCKEKFARQKTNNFVFVKYYGTPCIPYNSIYDIDSIDSAK